MSDSTTAEWKKLAIAAAIGVPVIGAFYAYWSARNYFSLKKLPGYKPEEAEAKVFAHDKDAKMQFRVVDLDGFALS
jgi:hypothetical protein